MVWVVADCMRDTSTLRHLFLVLIPVVDEPKGPKRKQDVASLVYLNLDCIRDGHGGDFMLL